MQSVSKNPLIATFQLSSVASLNSGQFQNGVLRNGLTESRAIGFYRMAENIVGGRNKVCL